MSHDTIISALNALSKVGVTSYKGRDHARNIVGESDRSAIILNASTLEHVVTHMLKRHMPNLNADETARMFGINGPLGTFSSQIMMAKGLGIIDRQMAKRLDIIRAMRNAAAHHVGPLNFDTPQIKDAVIQLASPPTRKLVVALDRFMLGAFLTHTQAIMSGVIGGVYESYDESDTVAFIRDLLEKQLDALRDTPEEE